MTENSFLEFSKKLNAKADISAFPAEFLHLHTGQIALYYPQELLCKVLRETTPQNRRRAYRVAIETVVANSRIDTAETIFTMAAQEHGKEFLREVLSSYKKDLASVLTLASSKTITHSMRALVWQTLLAVAPQDLGALIRENNFEYFKNSAAEENIPAMEMAIAYAHKHCEPKVLQDMLCSGWIEKVGVKNDIKTIEYVVRRARGLKGEGFARRVYADDNFTVAGHVTDKNIHDLFHLAKEIGGVKFHEKSLPRFIFYLIHNAMKDDDHENRVNHTKPPRPIAKAELKMLKNLSVKTRLKVLQQEDYFLLRKAFIYDDVALINSLLNYHVSCGTKGFASALQVSFESCAQTAIMNRSGEPFELLLDNIRNHLPEEVYRTLVTDMVTSADCRVFYFCCEAGNTRMAKRIMQLAEETGGVEQVKNMITAKGHRTAYYASNPEIIALLAAFADRIGDTTLKSEIIDNSKYNTFVGDKQSVWEPKAEPLSPEEMSEHLRDARLHILRMHTDRAHINLELHEKSRYGFNPELYEELWPLMKNMLKLDEDLIPLLKGRNDLLAVNKNISDCAYMLACVFDNVHEVNDYFVKHMPSTKETMALCGALPAQGIWNKERWKKLLMHEGKAIVPFLSRTADIDEMLRRGRMPAPENSADVKLLALSATLAQLPDVNIRHSDVMNFAKDGKKYRLVSPCTFGLEQEFFGLNTDTVKHMRSVFETIDPGWKLKQDEGISFGNNIWRGAETNSPIINNDNLADTVLATHIINNFKIWVNSSCSFHVHAGIDNIFSKAERLEVMKQIAINYIKLEDDLSFLDHTLTHSYKDIAAKVNSSISLMIGDILKAKNVEELITAMRPDREDAEGETKLTRMRIKMNLHALKRHGTFEFRHHVGTNSATDVISWLLFLDRLIAHSVDNVRKHARAGDYNDQETLKALVGDYTKMRGHTSIVNDQALPRQKRDLVEGTFRKTNVSDKGACL